MWLEAILVTLVHGFYHPSLGLRKQNCFLITLTSSWDLILNNQISEQRVTEVLKIRCVFGGRDLIQMMLWKQRLPDDTSKNK